MKKFIFALLFIVSFANSSDIKQLEKECNNGVSVVPCDIVADAYLYAQGVEPDDQKALKFFKKACDGGLYNACFKLGAMHEEALGTKADMKTAMKFYELSCEGEFGDGCLALAEIYSKENDSKKALPHYEKACEFGSWRACEFLAKHYETKDTQKATNYYQKTCKFGKEWARWQILPVGVMKIKEACNKAEF